MPQVSIYPPAKGRTSEIPNSLPQLLHTPRGLAIVELQGSINMPSTSSFELRDSTLVGRLSFPDYSPANPAEDAAWQKKVYLYVGRHQRLTGEVKKLAKPLGLIRRRVKGHSNGEVTDEDELEILEIVSWKIVFSSRPEPVGAGTE